MGKRTIALLLTVIMVIGFIPLPAYAVEITGEGYSFDSGSGTLTITSDSGTINWKNDTGIESKSSIRKLVIENSVATIQPSAFGYCTNLISVTIPDSVYSIGNYAFECCFSLVSATFLGSTAPSLGTGVFSDCKTGFRIYYLAEGTGYDSLGYTAYSAPVVGSGYSFEPATGLLTISSNSGTTSWCSANRIPRNIIASLVIENGVTSIGESAFADCSSLREADLPDSLTSLGADAFNCTALTEIIIPDGVTAIPEWAFFSCQSLSSVTIPDSVTAIGDYAFTYCPLTALSLPENLTSIGTQAFYGCRSIETLIIPDKVTDIGTRAFFGCNSLREITFPAGVTSIGASAFAACTSLASAIFKGLSAPTFGTNVFTLYTDGVTIYYPAGGTGYDSLGYPAVPVEDTTPPAAPVILSPTDGSTISTNIPMFTGTAEAGSTVTIFLDGISAGTTTAGAAGNWSLTPGSVLDDGTHNVKATATDAAENVSADSNVSAFTVDTTPPVNTAPVRKSGVAAAATASITVNTAYTLNLAAIFEDADADPLTYNVSVDGANPVATVADYVYTPTATGTSTLVFKANDGTVDSTDTYTVTLTANLAAPVTTYTVTFNSNGSVYATTTVTAGASIGSAAWPADPVRSSYTFESWFTGENGAGTQFTSATPVNATMTVYAKWSYSGGGGSGGGSSGGRSTPSTPAYNADVKAGNGSETTLPVTVNKDNGSAAIDTGSQQLTSGETVITAPSIPGIGTYSVGIPVPDLSKTDVQGTLTLNTGTGSVTVPFNMLTGVAGADGDKAEITIGQGDKSNLPADVKDAIGDKPLVQLTLSIDGRQTNWSNPDAPVIVSIPYTPAAAELESPEGIIVWYIDGSGSAVCVPNGHYDPATGMVTFQPPISAVML